MGDELKQNSANGKLLLLIAVAVVAMGLGVYFGSRFSQQDDSSQPQSLKLYPEAKVIADFALTNQLDESLNLSNLHGRWHLVFFGFTHCPDICPATLAQLAQVMQQLRAGLPERLLPRVLFISVDPERDNAETLQRYVSYFDPQFIGATGEHPQLTALSYQLGTLYTIEEHEKGELNYNVDHSASIILLDPQGRLKGLFPAPHDVNVIAADMKRLLERS